MKTHAVQFSSHLDNRKTLLFGQLNTQSMLLVLAISLPPLGAVKRTWREYEAHVDESSGVFTCLDGSKSIPLSQFNDGFLDCPDGSDEPSTGADPNATFFCRNNGVSPMKIRGWSVGDGLCDCCDGSDEALNTHAHCPNTCDTLERERDAIYNAVVKRLQRGLDRRRRLEKSAPAALEALAKKQRRHLAFQEVCQRAIPWLRNSQNATEQAREAWQQKLAALWKSTFRPRRPSKRPSFAWVIKNALADDLEKWNASLAEDIERVKQLQKVAETWPAAVHLFGERFSSGEYTVELMVSASQWRNSLGKFKNVSGNAMYFDDGDACWKAQNGRSLELKLRCSDRNALVRVEEPSICVYSGIFTTPLVCTEEDARMPKPQKLKKVKEMQRGLP